MAQDDIVARGITKYRPAGKEEQQVSIIRGPYDPGGQPELRTDNALYLGLAGWDVAGGAAVMKANRGNDRWSWRHASHLIREAERVGLEFELPLGFGHGFGGEAGYAETTLDNFAATCGLASITSKILLFSTAEVNNLHPLHVARLGANFDHVSGGRWGLHFRLSATHREAALFGNRNLGAEAALAMADEFVTLMKHSWALCSPFDFRGEVYDSKHVLVVGPKPTRVPRPFIVVEASGAEDVDFAAKQCDWIICRGLSPDGAEVGRIAVEAKTRALERYNRELKSVARVFAVMATSDSAAQDEFELMASDIDEEAADAVVEAVFFESAFFGEERTNGQSARQLLGESRYRQIALGLGAIQVVGSYDTVAEKVRALATDYQQDGLAFLFPDSLIGIHQLEDELIPRLRRMGLRR